MTDRYQIVFTPVGWQVVDTLEARDALAEFGTGRDEYRRASAAAAELNAPPEYATHKLNGIVHRLAPSDARRYVFDPGGRTTDCGVYVDAANFTFGHELNGGQRCGRCFPVGREPTP